MKKNPKYILKSLSGLASRVYVDKSRFSRLIMQAKNKMDDIGNFSDVKREVFLLLDLSKSFVKGEYRDISKANMILIIASFIYFVNPMDMVPDILLGIGFLDDFTIFSYLISKIRVEIKKYEDWKEEQV